MNTYGRRFTMVNDEFEYISLLEEIELMEYALREPEKLIDEQEFRSRLELLKSQLGGQGNDY